MLTITQLTAVFAMWDKRAKAEKWDGPQSAHKASAETFDSIARELFPEAYA